MDAVEQSRDNPGMNGMNTYDEEDTRLDGQA
jgi:hypothetical protein